VLELDQVWKLQQRRHQRQQILELLNTFSKFTDRSLAMMARLRTRFVDVSYISQSAEAARLLANSSDRLTRLGQRASVLQRSLQAAAASTDELLSCPDKLAESLDDDRIDRALESTLTRVERARLDLQAQVLEIDAITDDVDRLLNQQILPS